MKLLWTEQALSSLKAIKFYIEDKSSEPVARNFINKLIEKGEVLTKFPEMGRVVPEINSQNIRELIEGNYRIVYRIHKERIEILTVFEGHKLLEKKEILTFHEPISVIS
ncbi:MAG: hypothetical protein BGO67_12850 [Alphaproteobacteria bacterium 41-28]|nr:MAG: hypothetical protein BGO67_12850 [Alphaproteobacteria bacterium 41-28]